MSHLHQNQENPRMAPKALRNENDSLAMPQKRPLSSQAPLDKRARVPLGGKDQNTLMPSMQRSKSSLAQQNPRNVLRPSAGSLLAAPSAITRSNSSLGFSHDPYNIVHNPVPLKKLPPRTNPHKNSLLAPQDALRSKDLVPRFQSDSLKKKDVAPKPPVARLSTTISDATRSLHANNIPANVLLQNNADPVKKGAESVHLESVIESLANDENSVETVPEKPAPLEYIPAGLEPLTADEAPALFESKKSLLDQFEGELFSDDEQPLGLTDADMNGLLDF